MAASGRKSARKRFTPCVCTYCPVIIEARLGEHSEVVTNMLWNRTPPDARRSLLGVRMKFSGLGLP